MALLIVPGMVSAQASVSVEPPNQTAYFPDHVSVEVRVNDVTDLYGFQFDLLFDESVVEYQGISKGSFLNDGVSSNDFCIEPDMSISGLVSKFACTRIVPGEKSGSGSLAVLNFSILSVGNSQLSLLGVKLSHANATSIATSAQNGEVNTANCTEGENVSCGPQNETGACVFGARTCTGGVLESCQGEVMPDEEECDEIDNNCNGVIDDVNDGSSVSSTDCQCYDGGSPKADEECPHNGIDDDCDGTIDEGTCDDDGGGTGGGCVTGQTRSCSGIGICQPAQETCSGGSWGTCTGSRQPSAETCNGIDDDCDGSVDEGSDCCQTGETRECGPSSTQGICQKGTVSCINRIWGACIGAVFPETEICDGADNDCDGQTDEDCVSDACANGAVPSGGCLCGAAKRTSGFCCSGLWYADGCPIEWGFLIIIGVAILVVLFVLIIIFRRRGEELNWKNLSERYGSSGPSSQ